jgi:hypothetical protein
LSELKKYEACRSTAAPISGRQNLLILVAITGRRPGIPTELIQTEAQSFGIEEGPNRCRHLFLDGAVNLIIKLVLRLPVYCHPRVRPFGSDHGRFPASDLDTLPRSVLKINDRLLALGSAFACRQGIIRPRCDQQVHELLRKNQPVVRGSSAVHTTRQWRVVG